MPARGTLTGNRGCLVDDDRQLVRHHNGALWIICLIDFRGRRRSLDRPRTWTPLFFLDDAVALAAGHRPCGYCRRADYLAYRQAVTESVGAPTPILAPELNRRLRLERYGPPRPGRRSAGFVRADRRIVHPVPFAKLPVGAVVLHGPGPTPHLVTGCRLQEFGFEGWRPPIDRPRRGLADVLTPPTSLAALGGGFVPRLHATAAR